MVETTRPGISVIIPCYNQGRFLAQAIDSILAQTYPHTQIVVVDDGSADNTPEVAQAYGDRIQYIQKRHVGVCAARNTGLLACPGDFVLFLDADDYLRPDALEKHMEAARREPDGVVFHGGWQEVDVEGQVLCEVNAEPLGDDPFHALLGGNHFPPVAMVVRRAALGNVGLFDVQLRSCEDWDLWLRLAAAGGRFVPVPDAFGMYRQHPSSASRNYERMWRTGLRVLLKSQTYHPNCRRCRRMLAWNIRKWRYRCLQRELAAYRSRGEAWRGITKAIRDTACSPRLMSILLQEPLFQIRRGIARGLHRSGPPSPGLHGSGVCPNE